MCVNGGNSEGGGGELKTCWVLMTYADGCRGVYWRSRWKKTDGRRVDESPMTSRVCLW